MSGWIYDHDSKIIEITLEEFNDWIRVNHNILILYDQLHGERNVISRSLIKQTLSFIRSIQIGYMSNCLA